MILAQLSARIGLTLRLVVLGRIELLRFHGLLCQHVPLCHRQTREVDGERDMAFGLGWRGVARVGRLKAADRRGRHHWRPRQHYGRLRRHHGRFGHEDVVADVLEHPHERLDQRVACLGETGHLEDRDDRRGEAGRVIELHDKLVHLGVRQRNWLADGQRWRIDEPRQALYPVTEIIADHK